MRSGGDGGGGYGGGRVGEIRDMVEVGNSTKGAVGSGDGMVYGVKGGIWLGVAEDIARVGTSWASVDWT